MTYSDKNIVDSWLDNAKPWITAVRENEIESRVLITNKAITECGDFKYINGWRKGSWRGLTTASQIPHRGILGL